MRNSYAGTCYRCGKVCEKGEGFFEKITRISRKKWPEIKGKWHVQHKACAEKFRNTDTHYLHSPMEEA